LPSLHVGERQRNVVLEEVLQTSSSQSASFLHGLLTGHGLLHAAPQSMPPSKPFRTPSEQLGSAQ